MLKIFSGESFRESFRKNFLEKFSSRKFSVKNFFGRKCLEKFCDGKSFKVLDGRRSVGWKIFFMRADGLYGEQKFCSSTPSANESRRPMSDDNWSI